jgi:hypothetical protein
MELDREDRVWLDKKFGEIHTRITRSDTTNAKLLNEQSTELTTKIGAVRDEARGLVEKHEEKHHDPVKFWGLIAVIVAVATGVGAFAMWLIKVGSVRP